MSRDGRYALRYGSTGIPGLDTGPVPALIDLSTGARVPVPGYTPYGRALASGGTVLTVTNDALVLWKQTASTPVSLSASGRTVLSDNAAVIVAESAYASGEPLSLLLYDVGAGNSSVLDEGSTSGYDASVTDDGRVVCYLHNSQVVLYDRIVQSEVPLPSAPDGVDEAVISGDGSRIWEATAAGRIVRLDVASGSAQQLVPRTPLVTLMLGAPRSGFGELGVRQRPERRIDYVFAAASRIRFGTRQQLAEPAGGQHTRKAGKCDPDPDSVSDSVGDPAGDVGVESVPERLAVRPAGSVDRCCPVLAAPRGAAPNG